jgi:hypothetical protein
MARRRRGRALKRRYGHSRRRPYYNRPSRAVMISALGLEPESRKRSLSGHMTDRYAATTQEFWYKILNGTSEAARTARRKLNIGDPS